MDFSLRHLINLVESLLLEDIALSKGSQQVMKNADMVTNLAKRVRRDARMNPHTFPPGFFKSSEKMQDPEVAAWFLSEVDKIEKQGYEGVQYSRDGVNNLWIASKYIAGGHNWEDITGTMSMNLGKWYFLKNRNMLDTAHANLPQFDSIREVGLYMVQHYTDALKDYDEKMKAAAMKKSVRAFLIVDNDDYKIYTTLNRAANVLLGLGTTWCTASSSYAGHFNSYSSHAMLFQMFPYNPAEVQKRRGDDRLITGKERYQFDASGAAGRPNFKDIADMDPDKEYIKEKFPYLYDDLVKGLRAKKADIETYMKTAIEDPALQSDDAKVKPYKIEDEIAKLDRLKAAGWFTDERRPRAAPAVPTDEPVPQLPVA